MKQQTEKNAPEWNGILCIDKEQGFTSFDVIAKMRGILHVRRLGHAGTLDPMATGVLPVFVGRATRACDLLPNQDKEYRASFQLGVVTDTQDIWGTEQERRESHVTRKELEEALKKFTGTFFQLPPMYSAVQVNGQRLYDLARQGIEVERARREVTVSSLKLLEFEEENQRGSLVLRCSKGTFVRTILHDLGEVCGCGGILTALRRTFAAGFDESSCVTLEQLERIALEGRVEEYLHPIGEAFLDLPKAELDHSRTRMFLNGVKLDLNRISCPDTEQDIRVMGADGEFLGLGAIEREQNVLKVKKILAPR